MFHERRVARGEQGGESMAKGCEECKESVGGRARNYSRSVCRVCVEESESVVRVCVG